jgi:UDPglucose--hexose-1-phosphate uridylyltransferase
MEGIGHHDVIVTRSHTKDFASLPRAEAVALLQIVQRMHRRFRKDGCSRYVSTFANWGDSAGASLYHPHYQLLALPIVPPHVAHSLEGSRNYFVKHRACVHCDMLRFERDAGTRIVESVPRAVAVAPFVSRQPFEVRVYPTRHASHFADAPLADIRDVAVVFQSVLLRMKKFLGDPDYNFFIHTAPLRRARDFAHYHWHIEVFPKISMLAGFELSTGVDINIMAPEEAAAVLKGERRAAGKDE